MTRRSETKPKKFSLVRFHVDDKYCIVESKKVKVDFPCAGQKDIDVALTIKSFFKADIIDVHGECLFRVVVFCRIKGLKSQM